MVTWRPVRDWLIGIMLQKLSCLCAHRDRKYFVTLLKCMCFVSSNLEKYHVRVSFYSLHNTPTEVSNPCSTRNCIYPTSYILSTSLTHSLTLIFLFPPKSNSNYFTFSAGPIQLFFSNSLIGQLVSLVTVSKWSI